MLFAVVVSLGGAGCGKTAPAPLATPEPSRAWVRLETLLASHPLEKTLPQLPMTRLPEGFISVPPSVLTTSPLPDTTSWEVAQKRRREARSTLQESDQQGIQGFAARLQQRETRFWAISQANFEAQERLVSVGKAKEDRLAAANSITEKVALLKDDLALAKTQYEISRILASPANDTLLTPDTPVKVQEEVTRLKAANLRAEIQTDALTGVRRAKVLWAGGLPPRNPRVLYAASRDVLKTLWDSLEAQVSKVEAEAEEKWLQSAQEREAEIQIKVIQHLEGLRSIDENFVLRLDQEQSLNQILLAEELPARRAVSTSPLPLPITMQGGAVALPPRSAPSSGTTKSVASDKARSALEAEVRAAVLDVAQRRGIRVSFSPSPGVPDRTAEFVNWIRVSL